MSEENVQIEKIPPSEQGMLVRPNYQQTPGYPYPQAQPYGYGYGYGEDDEKVYIRRMWRAVKKRLWLIAVLAVIITTVITIESFRNKSIYKSSATVEIEKENRTLVRSGDFVVQADEGDDTYAVAMGMKTKIRLLQSRPLLEDVVVALKLDENPRFLDVTQKKSVWDALRSISGKFKSSESDQPLQVANANQAIPDNPIERSPEESARLAPYVDVLSANLSAEPVPETRMLAISFTHTDPVIAANVANVAARIFIERSFDNKTEKFKDTSEWLDRSTRELQARVEQAEKELADYSRTHNIFSADGKETLIEGKLARLYDQATRAETERMLKESLYEQVKAGHTAELPESFSDPNIGALQTKLNELNVQAAELDVKFGPKHQKVQEVQQKIAAIKSQIESSRLNLEEKLKADYERAVRDENSMKAALERAKAEAVGQDQASIQLNILKQKVETAKQLYTDFLQRTNQAKVQSAEQHNNMRLVDPAVASFVPVGPNRMRTIMIGLLVSLVAGVLLALFLEYLDNTIKTVEDVNRYAQLPALSVIPAITGRRSPLLISKKVKSIKGQTLDVEKKSNSTQLVMASSRSSVAEAYRVLRTSVLLSTAGSPPKIILVTSAQPGEGKTTTTVNTAISLAQLGSSVLVIDCDLRKPSTHKVFGVDNSEGLSTYLSRDVGIEDLIQPLPITNLSLLASGPIPPNPAELISSNRMRELLKSLAEKYDHILIDSPPLISVTDPVILSTMADGVILVVHGGRSTREVVRHARQELATANAKIFGVVLNNVDLKRDGYYDYYYTRYSQYGEEGSGTSGD